MELKEIRLYGHLGKKFGRSFKLVVQTPIEAFRALSVNIPGFKEYFIKHSYHIFLDKQNISEKELESLTSAEVIKFVPTTIGSGGLFKIIIGAILIYFPATRQMGIAMVLGGVSELLFAPPRAKNSSSERPENTPSYIFNGAVNTVGQGNAVALCYGRLRVGSQVVSAGLTSREIPI